MGVFPTTASGHWIFLTCCYMFPSCHTFQSKSLPPSSCLIHVLPTLLSVWSTPYLTLYLIHFLPYSRSPLYLIHSLPYTLYLIHFLPYSRSLLYLIHSLPYTLYLIHFLPYSLSDPLPTLLSIWSTPYLILISTPCFIHFLPPWQLSWTLSIITELWYKLCIALMLIVKFLTLLNICLHETYT